MSQWIDRIRDHQVWQQMKALGPSIDQARTREDIDPQTIDGLERVRTVLAFIGKRLAGADPFTTQPAPLDGLAGAFQNASAEIQAFTANGNPGHIVNANSHADTALQHVAQIVVGNTPEELAGLKDAAVAYRSTLEKQLGHAAAAAGEVSSGTTALKASISDLSTQIAAERQSLSQLASEFQGQFSAAQEARSREFSDNQTARQEKYAAIVQKCGDDISELKDKYSTAAEGVVRDIETHRERVEKLVGVIGNLGVTSGYLKTANYAQRSVWIWQGVTVLAMAGLIAVAYKAFIPIVQGEFTWAGFAGKGLLTVTVGVLAAYSGSQADKFFEMERRNRKMALELEAIGPYLAPLPQEQQDEFRVALGERSFGREDPAPGRRADKSPATLVDVLMKSKEFRDFVTEIVRAARPG